MSDAAHARTYYEGDEIRLRVSFTHQGNVGEVRVLYELQDNSPRVVITLAGELEKTEELPDGTKRSSEALLLYYITEENVHGTYKPAHIQIRSPSGWSIRMPRLDEADVDNIGQATFRIDSPHMSARDLRMALEDPPDEEGY